MKRSKGIVLLLLFTAFGKIVSAQTPSISADKTVWYTSPGQDWNTQALHIGNGYMGTSFYGGVETECFDISEETFWTGKPSEVIRLANGELPEGKSRLAEIQKEILGGNYRKADELTSRYLSSDRQGFGYFTNVGQLSLHFKNQKGNITDYQRGLELADGYGFVNYQCGETRYQRTYFCSYSDKVMAVKLSANQPKSLSLDIMHSFTHPVVSSEFSPNGIWTMNGKIADNNQQYTVRLLIENEGGSIQFQNGKVSIEQADEVYLYYIIDTEYLQNSSNYRGVDPEKSTESVLKKVRKAGYKQLWDRHLSDFRELFGRVEFNLVGDTLLEKLPTDQRIGQLKKGITDDSSLKALWFNFGRYMIISASRPQTLPSNLQGVWNNSPKAVWNGNYQSNINLQEMYWSCGALRLEECEEAYVNWIKDLVPSGRQTAKAYYGTNGWISHATGSIWGHSTPGNDILWGFYPCGAAWHCRHLWMHYVYTQDRDYLKKVYPILKEAAEFWLENLIEKDGYLMVIPSVSAEHGIQVDGNDRPVPYTTVNGEVGRKLYTVPAYQDVAMVKNLFMDLCQAMEVLDCDEPMHKQLTETIKRMQPFKVGKYGQLQEWLLDVDNPRDHHRHIAHLYAMYPGDLISLKKTPDLAEAVKRSLLLRGSGKYGDRWPHTGGNWSMIWRTALWSRLHEGDQAIQTFNTMIRESGYENMCTNQSGHFMVDAIMATPGVFADMIVQVEDNCINLLPALPVEWPEGSVKGLRLPGGYLIDMSWKNGTPQKVTVHTPQGKASPEIQWKEKAWNGAVFIDKV